MDKFPDVQPHRIGSRKMLAELRRFEPLTQRWYLAVPPIMRRSMELQGYDADDFLRRAEATLRAEGLWPPSEAGGE